VTGTARRPAWVPGTFRPASQPLGLDTQGPGRSRTQPPTPSALFLYTPACPGPEPPRVDSLALAYVLCLTANCLLSPVCLVDRAPWAVSLGPQALDSWMLSTVAQSYVEDSRALLHNGEVTAEFPFVWNFLFSSFRACNRKQLW
jgi:hypothetical protein